MEKNEIIKFIEETISKKFEKKDKGYSPIEVDETLDKIFQNFSHYIKDYEKLIKDYSSLQEQYGDLKTKYEVVEKQNKMYSEEIKRLESSGASLNAFKQRMENLENQMAQERKKSKKVSE